MLDLDIKNLFSFHTLTRDCTSRQTNGDYVYARQVHSQSALVYHHLPSEISQTLSPASFFQQLQVKTQKKKDLHVPYVIGFEKSGNFTHK